jgi:hypothetical protein
MHQTVYVMLQTDKRAEARQLGNLAGDQIADLVELVDVLPRIGAELFDADCNAN